MSWSRYHYLRWSFMRIRIRLRRGKRRTVWGRRAPIDRGSYSAIDDLPV
jgi:hypothetical protein